MRLLQFCLSGETASDTEHQIHAQAPACQKEKIRRRSNFLVQMMQEHDVNVQNLIDKDGFKKKQIVIADTLKSYDERSIDCRDE